MTHTGFSGSSGIAIVILALLASIALIAMPASAATKYLGGEPSFSATVSGVNEFLPGEDITLSILVKNSGTFDLKQLNRGSIQPEDMPTTAKFVTIGLSSGSDAVIVKTDPQMIGDLAGNGDTTTVKFNVKISSNATAGEYQLPLSIGYRYPRVEDQGSADVLKFIYNEAEQNLPVTLKIKPQVKIEVMEVVPEQLNAGSQGWLNVKIRNIGPENGEKASVKLLRNGNSPIIPEDSTQFIGNITSGDILDCRFKVSVLKDATNQSYPVDIAITYTNREGTIVTSPIEPVGVPVNSKTAFTVTSPVIEVPKGASRTIEVQYRNDGDVTVYNTEARLEPHDPLTMTDSNAFLGDIGPGETAIARYEIQADAAADTKVYTFDSTVRFRDAFGNSQMSDTVPVPIKIVPAAGISPGLIAIVGCIIVVIGIAIALTFYRKKKESR
jgi:hypothetical protein